MPTTTRRCSAPCCSDEEMACPAPEFTDAMARRILHAEHAVTCGRWLAAVAYLSAGLDDD
ncbi:hypothetical protein [Nocardia wallacei]|uniref:hypothetical protein n=1 Tax=Nocardia wallacei TaxID=480035 RepID=UPI0024550139|nr:hypothetical protein [Nocardia wallacei]